MKIFLIRHGETTGDIEGRFGGDYDDYMTERGLTQAYELAESLQGKEIELIIHSPRIRARQTAEIIAKKIAAPLEEIDTWRERNNYGVLSGLTREESEQKHPEELAKIDKDKIYHDVKDSESYEEIKDRVERAFSELSKLPHNTIAVVSHGGVISTIMREVMGHATTKIGDCGFFEIEYDGKKHSITSVVNAEIVNQ